MERLVDDAHRSPSDHLDRRIGADGRAQAEGDGRRFWLRSPFHGKDTRALGAGDGSADGPALNERVRVTVGAVEDEPVFPLDASRIGWRFDVRGMDFLDVVDGSGVVLSEQTTFDQDPGEGDAVGCRPARIQLILG